MPKQGGQALLDINDDGPGIEPAVAADMFDRFVSDRAGGSGLGLSIARYLADAMGAELSGTEGADGGACFTLRLAAFRTTRPPEGPAAFLS